MKEDVSPEVKETNNESKNKNSTKFEHWYDPEGHYGSRDFHDE